MLELHQFRHSPFCLKVRMVLALKKLSYRTVEVTPGVGQLTLFRLSGQRQVPILVDDDNVLNDSSTIIRYLDKIRPEPQLIPDSLKQAAQVHLIEDWADTTFANLVRTTLIKAAAVDKELRLALLPGELPNSFREIMKGLPCGLLGEVTDLFGQGVQAELFACLEQVAFLLKENDWLVGTSLSSADLAFAAQLSLLRFPVSAGAELAGRGCSGFSDHPLMQHVFEWRDKLEGELFSVDSENV